MRMCGGLGDESIELMEEITKITASLPKEVASTLDSTVANLVSCAQAAITEAARARSDTEDKLETLQQRLLAIETANGQIACNRLRASGIMPPTPPPSYPPEMIAEASAGDPTVKVNAVAVAAPGDMDESTTTVKKGATTASEEWQTQRAGKKQRNMPTRRASIAPVTTHNRVCINCGR
jgi:hypothetical protein